MESALEIRNEVGRAPPNTSMLRFMMAATPTDEGAGSLTTLAWSHHLYSFRCDCKRTKSQEYRKPPKRLNRPKKEG